MSRAVIGKRAAELDPALSAHMVYMEGYPYTGFAILHIDGTLELPPGIPSQDLNWDLFWDIRVFSEKGDWHAWRLADGKWRGRIKHADSLKHPRARKFVLAGNAPPDGAIRDGWARCSEASGAVVWLPARVIAQGHPVWLKIVEEIDRESETGLAGVVDAVFTGFERFKGE